MKDSTVSNEVRNLVTFNPSLIFRLLCITGTLSKNLKRFKNMPYDFYTMIILFHLLRGGGGGVLDC